MNIVEGMDINTFKQLLDEGAMVLDTRTSEAFMQGFIPSSIFMGKKEKWPILSESILPKDRKYVLISEPQHAGDAIQGLDAAGLPVAGYLAGGFEAWQQSGAPIDMVIDIDADEFLMDLPHDQKLMVIDVRPAEQFTQAHVQGAANKPVTQFGNVVEMAAISDDHNLYVHCGGGSSAMIAASLLKYHGYDKIRVINGGFPAICALEGMPIVENNAARK